MSPKLIRMLSAAVILCCSISSCNELDPFSDTFKTVAISDFDFGFISEANKFQKFLGLAKDQFVRFTPYEQYLDLIEREYIDSTQIERNEIEFQGKPYKLHIKGIPEYGDVDEIVVKSSADSIVSVKSIGPGFCEVEFHDYGDVDFTVFVKSNARVFEKTYQMRVIGTVDVKFRITPFWLRAMTTRIRMALKNIPDKYDDLFLLVRDSVTVIGYCEYFDHNKYGYVRQFCRDTVTYPCLYHSLVFRKGSAKLLRDVSNAISKFESMRTLGTEIHYPFTNMDVYEIRDHEYPWHAEQVFLHWLPACDNPYIRFTHSVNSKKTFDHLVVNEDGLPSDEDDEGETVQLEDEDMPDEDDVETLNYFNIAPLDVSSQRELDSLANVVNDLKQSYGYSYELPDEKKDSLLKKIDQVMNDAEKEDDSKSSIPNKIKRYARRK